MRAISISLLLLGFVVPACDREPVLLLTVGAESRVDTYDLVVQRRSDRTSSGNAASVGPRGICRDRDRARATSTRSDSR